MIRRYKAFSIKDAVTFKQQMLNWSNSFNICCFLDNHSYSSIYNTFDCVVAAGVKNTFEPGINFFDSLSTFYKVTNDWIFGHFNYDLKNNIENLHSAHPSYTAFPQAFLYVPEMVLTLKGTELNIGCFNQDPINIYNEIMQVVIPVVSLQKINLLPRFTKEAYMEVVEKLQQHILRGDCYEINFCQEFYADHATIPPAFLFKNSLQNHLRHSVLFIN